jgi:hypothetical protein
MQQSAGPTSCPVRVDTGLQFFSQIRGSGLRQPTCLLTAVLLLTFMCFGVQAEEDVVKTIFLVTEDDRVIAANGDTGQFFELELHAKETIEQSHVANGVAVLVTNQRFAAIGAFPGGWRSIRRQADESFVSAEAAGYSALVLTSDRILSFSGRSGSWSSRSR